MKGWLRSDGRKGIRNVVAVAYLVECAHHVAREIVAPFRERDVHLIGFPGCLREPICLRCDAPVGHASEYRRGAVGISGLRGIRQARVGSRQSLLPAVQYTHW